jgi:adenine-specific DNA glycosylase
MITRASRNDADDGGGADGNVQICKARGPKCGECVLRDDCHYSQTLKEKKKELKLDDGEEEEEEKATTSKRRSRSTAERGGASKKGTKRANREEDDDGDQEYGEDREGTTLVRKAKSDGAANKRVAKRRRSAPASIIGDIEDSA